MSTIESRSFPADESEDGVGSAGILDSLKRALRGLRFGTITLVVHDGAVVQIDRTEKLRVTAKR